MKTDWLPNWRDESQYPDPDETSPGQWAWEFLRRNPEYQRDYARWSAVPGLTWGKPSPNTPLELWAVCDPPPLVEETEVQYKSRLSAERKPWLINSLFKVLCEKYGLSSPYLPDPRKAAPGFMFSLVTAHGPAHISDDAGELEFDHPSFRSSMRPESVSEVVVKFDLNMGIDEQLKRIKHTLKYEQQKLNTHKSTRKQNSRLYGHYLRVLDAKADGASHLDIAKVLYPDQKDCCNTCYPWKGAEDRIKKNLRAAKRLRDHDYLYIVV